MAEEMYDFDAALEQLNQLGLPLPPSLNGITAIGSRFNAGVEEVIEAVQAVNRYLAQDDRSGSASMSATPSQSLVQPCEQVQEDERRQRGHSVELGAIRNGGGNSRGLATSRRKRIPRSAGYIDDEFDSTGLLLGGICRYCKMKLKGRRERYRVFHIIVCSVIPYQIRMGFYATTRDKDKPPLLLTPPHGMRPTEAGKLKEACAQDMDKLLQGHLDKEDPTRVPNMARFILARRNIDMKTVISECSEDEERIATGLLLELIVEENLPFAVCDNRDQYPRALGKLLNYLRTGYKMPLGSTVRGKLLEDYYNRMRRDVLHVLKGFLHSCRGTVMFDGSEDVNGAPMVNVLLRLMGTDRASTNTFFFTSVYTGYDTCDSDYYVRVVEDVMKDFGGFSGIAGVVTDNTISVKNAREALEQGHGRLVASQDQAHVADLLMSDFGELGWMKEALEKLSDIGSIIRRHRKLRAKLLELMTSYNRNLRHQNITRATGGARTNAENECNVDLAANSADMDDRHVLHFANASSGENDGESEFADGHVTEYPENPSYDLQRFNSASQYDVQPLSHPSNPGPAATVPIAKTIKRVSIVRFASSEKLLDEYISLRPVLLQLVNSASFEYIYAATGERERAKRQNSFVEPILSEALLHSVQQMYAIFKACRTYLRVFDAETSLASEVFEATRILEKSLEALPLSYFPEPQELNRQELMEVFRNRKEGPLPGRKKVKVTLLSDLHVTAALLDPCRTPSDPTIYMESFRRHLQSYLQGVDMSELGIEESGRELFTDEIINRYSSVRAMWLTKGLTTNCSESTASRTAGDGRPSLQHLRKQSPIIFWTTGRVSIPRDTYSRKATEELIEFARRTLSVSPTATATERTFSLHSRIHTVQRAKLRLSMVRKLLFCQWNARVLRKMAEQDEVDIAREVEKQMEVITKLRSLRKKIETEAEDVISRSARTRSEVQSSGYQNVARVPRPLPGFQESPAVPTRVQQRSQGERQFSQPQPAAPLAMPTVQANMPPGGLLYYGVINPYIQGMPTSNIGSEEQQQQKEQRTQEIQSANYSQPGLSTAPFPAASMSLTSGIPPLFPAPFVMLPQNPIRQSALTSPRQIGVEERESVDIQTNNPGGIIPPMMGATQGNVRPDEEALVQGVEAPGPSKKRRRSC